MNAITIIGVITAFVFLFLSLLALCAEKGRRPFRRVRDGFGRLPVWEKMLLPLFVGAWLVFASEKNDGTNGVSQVEGGTNTVVQIEGGTNDWSNVEGTNVVGQTDGGDTGTNGTDGVGGLLTMGFFGRSNLVQGIGPTITGDDVERMFRVATTFNVNLFAEPTANAVTNADWRDYGGLSDSLRIKPEGWRFPFGGKTATGLTVFENGEFRPDVKTHFFPPPFDAKLSLLPRMNWGLLPNGGESVFWHEQTPSNSLVLTWHNALYNRDVNSPTNFQAELYADGRFDYRYPDHTVQYAPVFPFDWDGDGLENSVDPEPLVAGPDAHGTNAEWYNRVCGLIFTNSNTPDNPNNRQVLLPNNESVFFNPGVNTNAYYFVNVTTESPTVVYFTADGPSNLGNPVVVTRSGEMNYVPLLIGVHYCVSSSVPVMVSAPTDVIVENRFFEGAFCFDVEWPLAFEETIAMTEGRLVHSFVPVPDCLGGMYNWYVLRNNHESGASLMGVPLPDSDCGFHFDGNQVGFECSNSDCNCGGCTAKGQYAYEGYTYDKLNDVACGCAQCPHSGIETPNPNVASFHLGFDRSVVIFEDSYEDELSHVVPRRSTTVTVSLQVSGGPHGGRFRITKQENLSRIVMEGGRSPSFDTEMEEKTLAPLEVFSRSYVCSGASASALEHDVKLMGYFVENDTNARIEGSGQLTVVRVDIKTPNAAPLNSRLARHRFGIGEEFFLYQFPALPRITVNAVDVTIQSVAGLSRVKFGVADVDHGLSVSLADAVYIPLIQVEKPSGIEGYDAHAESGGLPVGVSGGLRLWQKRRVLPLSVSFYGLAIEEVPCAEEIPPDLYFQLLKTNEQFSSLKLSHTVAAGAGYWHDVESGNSIGGGVFDKAGNRGWWPRMKPNGEATDDTSFGWLGGGDLVWKVPFGWAKRGTQNGAPPVKQFAENTRQIFHISANGDFTMSKTGHSATRTLGGVITVDGTPSDGVPPE